MTKALRFLSIISIFAVSAFAQKTNTVTLRDAVGVKAWAAAPRLSMQVNVLPAVTLDSANLVMPEKVVAMQQRNASGIEPMQNGIGRPLGDAIRVDLRGPVLSKSGPVAVGRGVAATTARGIAWSGSVQVNGADRLRLHLSNVNLPADATLWVYGSGEPIAFGRELVDPAGGLWTPSASGSTVHIEVEVASGEQASFAIDNVMELFETRQTQAKPGTEDDPSCLVDVTCVGVSTPASPLNLSVVERAIAHLEFVDNGGSFVCTGGLLNNNPSSGGNPAFLLTANHCISTQTSASSLQAYWDWKYADCSSTTIPPLSTVPVSNGATLLTTSSKDSGGSDVTLLRLNSIPSNRALLGWNASTSAVPAGTVVYRVSHPAPDGFGPQPQQYSSTTIATPNGTCQNLPLSRFLYSTNLVGGTYGGSSGSPVMLANAQVVGQLFGACAPSGHDPSAGCDPAVLNVDGAFSASYPLLKPFIDNGGSNGGACTQSDTTMCLNNNRFAVSTTYLTTDGSNGPGHAVKLTDDTGYFWFFSSTNVEAVIKVLNGCGLNSHYWAFAGGLTNVKVVITITDTQNGTTKTYTNPINTAFQPIQDTGAFGTCP